MFKDQGTTEYNWGMFEQFLEEQAEKALEQLEKVLREGLRDRGDDEQFQDKHRD